MGREDVAGADQIVANLAATPDERLDSLTALVAFIDEGRDALSFGNAPSFLEEFSTGWT